MTNGITLNGEIQKSIYSIVNGKQNGVNFLNSLNKEITMSIFDEENKYCENHTCKECKYCEQKNEYYYNCKYWNICIKKEYSEKQYCSRFSNDENRFQEFIWLLVFVLVFVAFLYAILNYTGIINLIRN